MSVSPLVSGGERYGVLPVPLLLLLLLPAGPPPAPAVTAAAPRHHPGGLRGERIVRLVGDVAAFLLVVTEVSRVVQDVAVSAWRMVFRTQFLLSNIIFDTFGNVVSLLLKHAVLINLSYRIRDFHCEGFLF